MRIEQSGVVACFCLSFLNAFPAIAQDTIPRSQIIVYGDPSEDWLDLMESYSELVDSRYRPVIIRGKGSVLVLKNASLVWFGDLTFDESEMADVPDDLKTAVSQLAAGMGSKPTDNYDGIVTPGLNCFTSHIDRTDNLPMVAVNFSGEDPQDVCKGFTIAHLLLGHQRWLKGEGTF
jgi:hypothetical protein